MSDLTTIQVSKNVLKQLKKQKIYSRQSYNELFSLMIKVFEKFKKSRQYDRFLNEIQQPLMKELWDNKEDEVWENA